MTELLRAMLFVPGHDARKLAKIPELEAGSYILDLEDSVPAEGKTQARDLVARTVREHGSGRSLWVRVNAVASGLLEQDLRAVLGPELAGIVLPKAGSPEDVELVDRLLGGSPCRLIATIEDAAALERASAIGAASPRVLCLGFGAGDLAAELRVEWPSGDGIVNEWCFSSSIVRAPVFRSTR